MKKLIVIMTSLLLVMCPFCTISAEDTEYDEALIKEVLYDECFSEMKYSEFEQLYDLFVNNFGKQTVPMELIAKHQGDIIETRAIKTGFYDYFSSVKWVNRSDGVTLQVYWKSYLFDFDVNEDEANQQMYRSSQAWKLLKNTFSNDSNWTNTTSMENQFYCHINYAGRNKNPYNLEPWRPVVSNAEMILCKCNPE